MSFSWTGNLTAQASERAAQLACDRCHFGLVQPPPVSPLLPVWEARLRQYVAGELQFCTCPAGMQRQQAFAAQLAAAAQRRQDQDAAHVVRNQKRQAGLFQAAGVPARYAAFTLAGFERLVGSDPGKRAALTTVRSYQAAGEVQTSDGIKRGIFLYGPPGVGKTGVLSPLFLELVQRGHTGLWVQYNDLMAEMRRFEDGQVDARMDACKNVEYLFIDDFGDPAAQRVATDYARDVIFRIVDHRSSRNLALFVTSNLTIGELADQFHERVARRLKTACAVVPVGGKVLK